MSGNRASGNVARPSLRRRLDKQVTLPSGGDRLTLFAQPILELFLARYVDALEKIVPRRRDAGRIPHVDDDHVEIEKNSFPLDDQQVSSLGIQETAKIGKLAAKTGLRVTAIATSP